jgi:type II secretory ATPase GspE/PulE/Tfp pilus assembly ATPase PilB-like protein
MSSWSEKHATRKRRRISVEAALTAQLVFTTLSTIGIIAERLARRLCQNCKVQAEVDETTLGYFGYTRQNAPPFFKGEGCEKCNHTGKKGRVGIYEVLVMSEDLKRAVAKGAGTDEIRALAIENGMLTLKDYAMVLMAQSLTSVDEVLQNLVVGN